MRELPPEYLDLCPIIDEKYRVVFKLGSGRFSKYLPLTQSQDGYKFSEQPKSRYQNHEPKDRRTPPREGL